MTTKIISNFIHCTFLHSFPIYCLILPINKSLNLASIIFSQTLTVLQRMSPSLQSVDPVHGSIPDGSGRSRHDSTAFRSGTGPPIVVICFLIGLPQTLTSPNQPSFPLGFQSGLGSTDITKRSRPHDIESLLEIESRS